MTKDDKRISVFLIGILVGMFIFFILLVGCGGGGGGGNNDNGTAPVVEDAVIFKITDLGWMPASGFSVGDEVNFEILATDPDLDMVAMIIESYLVTGSELDLQSIAEVQIPPQTEATETYYLDSNIIVEGPAGDYQECVYIVDARGNESAEYCKDITVFDF